MKASIRVFYENQLYAEYWVETTFYQERNALPERAIIYFSEGMFNREWYRKDLTPILESDVPKELHTLNLLLK